MNKTKYFIKHIIKSIGLVSLFALVFLIFLFSPEKTEAALDNSRIIEDSTFSASNNMSEAQIQAFLISKGSYLAGYTVPAERDIAWQGVTYHESPWIGPIGVEVNSQGWSAAHVIYQVSQWYGINPQVLLTTLQKESSLVTSPSPAYYGLEQWAMGYAYTEGGIVNACGTGTNHNPSGSCAGFAMQMDWAGGSLKNWQERANAHTSGDRYYTGNTIVIDGQSIYLANGATAALYKYTPHIQTNFYNIFMLWFGVPYDYQYNSSVNPPPGMAAGSTAFVQIHIRNTGSNTWYNEASSNPMRLAVVNADGKTFWPNNDTWVGNDRIAMTSPSVAPGQIGTFGFTIKAPPTPGNHTIHFVPVVEGVQALKDVGMVFTTTISYDYQFVASVNPPTSMTAVNTAFVQIHIRNTGVSTWYNEASSNPMRLAVVNADGKTFWPNNDTWVGNDRIAMTSPSVAPGQIGTFGFTIKAPPTPGNHTIHFVPVVEGVQALKDVGMVFTTTISYDYQYNSSVNPPPTMAAGSTAFVQIHIRNTGLSTWYNEALYGADPVKIRPMRLAVVNADGKTFWPNNDTWVGNDRIAMTSPSVAPGQIGTFGFTIKAPPTPGNHTIHFVPVVEGVQALKDVGMVFGTTVQ